MDINVVNSIGKVNKICDYIKVSNFFKPLINGRTFREAVNIDLIHFVLFLSASDGYVKGYETQFIKKYFNIDFTTQQAVQFINENIDRSSFLNEKPFALDLFIKSELNGIYTGSEIAISSILISTYLLLGMDLINSDSDINKHEIIDLFNYINMLQNNVYKEGLICGKHAQIISTIFSEHFENDSNFVPIDVVENEDNEIIIDEDTDIDELLIELNSLVGLERVKNDVQSLVNIIRISKIKEERGIPEVPMSYHLVFSGNPGTGKTTVARLLARIYNSLDLLSKGHLVEVDRSGLVGGYVGQTALKVQEVVQKALGGVLFIDEAYSLTSNKDSNDYGREAVETLLKAMEDNRDDLIIIVAGYTELMEKFLDSNPGLRSRFNKYILFEDYNAQELQLIFERFCNKSHLKLTSAAKEFSYNYFQNRCNLALKNFANARDVRNYFEKAITNQANRLSLLKNIDNDSLVTIELNDIVDIVLH